MGLSTIAARATAALCVILTYVLGAATGMVEGGGGGTCGAVCVCGVCMCVFVYVSMCVWCCVVCGVWCVLFFIYNLVHLCL